MKLGKKATALVLSTITMFSLIVPTSAEVLQNRRLDARAVQHRESMNAKSQNYEKLQNGAKTLTITKELQMPAGVTTPNTSFVFDFTATGYKSTQGGGLDTGTKGPAVTSPSATYTKAMTGSEKNGVKYVVVQTDEILKGFDLAKITKPGHYFYTVKERADTYVQRNDDSVTGDFATKMEYSKAEYTAVISVIRNNGNLEVDRATVLSGKDDEGNDNSNEGKVNGTENPDKDAVGKKENDDGIPYGNDFRFVSRFNRTNGTSITNPVNTAPGTDPRNTGLWLGKYVTGALGDTTKYFDFTIKVTNPTLKTDIVKDTYKAYIVKNKNADISAVPVYESVTEAEAKEASADAKFNPAKNLYYVELTSGQEKSVKLKNNFAVAVYEVATGAKFEASETNPDDGYETRLNLTVNGKAVAGKHLLTDEQVLGDAGKNTVYFTNNKENTPFTGLVINNLPLIAAAAAAAAGLGLVLLTNVKKAGRNED